MTTRRGFLVALGATAASLTIHNVAAAHGFRRPRHCSPCRPCHTFDTCTIFCPDYRISLISDGEGHTLYKWNVKCQQGCAAQVYMSASDLTHQDCPTGPCNLSYEFTQKVRSRRTNADASLFQ